MSETCSPRKILALRAEGVPIVDVRSPGEFSRAHLLGAYSLPLFSDEERAAVGTLYAQEGRDAAVELGLEYVGGKMRSLVQEAKTLAGESGRIGVYCARGGMRSEAVAWLLSIAGLSVYRMEGGYRAYHQEMMQEPLQYALIILGGATGCGKTEVLSELAGLGQQVVDLEGLARHRGSVFGGHPDRPQPSGEQFLNLLGEAFLPLDPKRPVWVEGESEMIGHCALTPGFWQSMQSAPFVEYATPREARVERIVAEYGVLGKEALLHAFGVIRKRLGAERFTQAREAVEAGDLHTAASLSLVYYDKAYAKCSQSGSWQHPVWRYFPTEDNPKKAAQAIIARLEYLQ